MLKVAATARLRSLRSIDALPGSPSRSKRARPAFAQEGFGAAAFAALRLRRLVGEAVLPFSRKIKTLRQGAGRSAQLTRDPHPPPDPQSERAASAKAAPNRNSSPEKSNATIAE
jgi:hypothetical protein